MFIRRVIKEKEHERMFLPPFSQHCNHLCGHGWGQQTNKLSDAPLDASSILPYLQVCWGNFPLEFSVSGWGLLALPPWLPLGGDSPLGEGERQAWSTEQGEGLQRTVLKRAAWRIDGHYLSGQFSSVKMKEHTFTFIPLNKPLEILEGKKSCCIQASFLRH